jgi:hypothetical protein
MKTKTTTSRSKAKAASRRSATKTSRRSKTKAAAQRLDGAPFLGSSVFAGEHDRDHPFGDGWV